MRWPDPARRGEPHAVLGSNTSSLPITGLADGVARPENFIGIHFFSPVEQMEPIEIIKGDETSDEADELSFGTIRKIMDETVYAAMDHVVFLDDSVPVAADVIATLMDQFGRTGKQGGAGFYDYTDGKRTTLWNDLRGQWNTTREPAASFQDLQDRLMFIQVIKTQKAFDDGVIDSDPDANIGSIFGIGFPPWTGGVRQFISGYPGGTEALHDRARQLADRYGSRFVPPATMQ
nr:MULTISPECIES: 3-hydroxyacyl-CoA dehydrogenase NAD-binding domain-containing protein [unclassified Mycolicibacterium]